MMKISLETIPFSDDQEELISKLLNDPQKKLIKNLISSYVQDIVNIPTEDDVAGFKREYTRGCIAAFNYLLILDTNARDEAREQIQEQMDNLPYSNENQE